MTRNHPGPRVQERTSNNRMGSQGPKQTRRPEEGLVKARRIEPGTRVEAPTNLKQYFKSPRCPYHPLFYITHALPYDKTGSLHRFNPPFFTVMNGKTCRISPIPV